LSHTLSIQAFPQPSSNNLGEDLGTEENFNTGEDDVKADIGEKPALEALVMNLGSFKEGMKG